jgi:hypothetical protein
MKRKLNFSYAVLAFFLLLFAACHNEVGASKEIKNCVIGPDNILAQSSDAPNDGRLYRINWTTVPNATGYLLSAFNESSGRSVLNPITVTQATGGLTLPYTCDSILYKIKPILPSGGGTLCIPDGQNVRLSRPRGGITVIIVNRTTGSTCNTNTSLKFFDDSSFVIGRTPMASTFSDGINSIGALENTFSNKILNNADSTGYLKIIVKNCAGVQTGANDGFVTRFQTQGSLTELSTAILTAAGLAGIPNPTTNTNAFIEQIRFEK